MSADQQGGALKPVTPARVAEELKKLSSQRKEGKLTPDEYEHRFARMIGELRDRRIDGSRADILKTLTPLKDEGVIRWQTGTVSPSSSDWCEPQGAGHVRPCSGRTHSQGYAPGIRPSMPASLSLSSSWLISTPPLGTATPRSSPTPRQWNCDTRFRSARARGVHPKFGRTSS